MKRIHIYLTDEQIKALAGLHLKTGAPMSEHIRRAIALYLRKQPKE